MIAKCYTALRENYTSNEDDRLFSLVLGKVKKALEEDKSDVDELRALLSEKRRRIQEFGHIQDTLRSLHAPIRNMPIEILSIIFTLVCGEGLEVKLALYRPPVLALAAVCTIWRKVVLELPDLWAEFHYDISPRSISVHTRSIKMFLERSRQKELTLRAVRYGSMSNEHAPVLDLIMQQAHRVGTLSVNVGYLYAERARQLSHSPTGGWPNLRTLEILSGYSVSSQVRVRAFERAPALRELSLVNIPISTIKLSWNQLTRVFLQLDGKSVGQIFSLLAFCTSLPNLKVKFNHSRRDDDHLSPHLFPTTEVVSSLTALAIVYEQGRDRMPGCTENVNNICRITRLPSLKLLQFKGISLDFYSINAYSACPLGAKRLTELVLHRCSFSIFGLLGALKHFPALMRLEIHDEREVSRIRHIEHPTNPSADHFFQALTVARRSSSSTPTTVVLLPMLSHLSLHVDGSGPFRHFEQRLLVKMVRSRWKYHSTWIRNLHVDLMHCRLHQSTADDLQSLSDYPSSRPIVLSLKGCLGNFC